MVGLASRKIAYQVCLNLVFITLQIPEKKKKKRIVRKTNFRKSFRDGQGLAIVLYGIYIIIYIFFLYFGILYWFLIGALTIRIL